jgi:hypothetical protein
MPLTDAKLRVLKRKAAPFKLADAEERGIKTAHERLEKGGSTTLAIQQLVDIRAILADFSKLLRNENPSEHKLRDVVKQSISINRIRFPNLHTLR